MRRWDDHPKNVTLACRAHVEPEEIGYVTALVEAHEGLALMRTKDEALGIVEFWVSPLMRADFEQFLDALRSEIPISTGPLSLLELDSLDE